MIQVKVKGNKCQIIRANKKSEEEYKNLDIALLLGAGNGGNRFPFFQGFNKTALVKIKYEYCL